MIIFKKVLYIPVIISALLLFSSLSFGDTDMDQLMQMSLDELMNVEIVTASKFMEKTSETPATMLVITDREIEQRGYTDLTQLFSDLPGVDVTTINGSGYFKPYTRGHVTEIANRTLLFINGINFQGLGFQDMKINRGFPLSAIKRIEILYGPSSAIYGPNAFSGIVNIITKSPEDLPDDQSEITYTQIGGGTFTTAYAEATYIGKTHDLSMLLSGRYFTSDEPDYSDRPGFFSNKIIRDSWLPMADRYNSYEDPTDDYTLFFKLNYKNMEIGFDRFYFAEGSGPEYALDKTLPSPQWKDFRNMAYLRYKKDVSAKMKISTLLSYKNGDTPPDSAWAERYDYNGDGNDNVSMGYWQFYNEQYSFNQDFVCRLNSQIIFNGGISLATTDYQKGYQINWGDWVEDYETAYPNYPEAPSDDVGEDKRFTMKTAGIYTQLKWKNHRENFFIVPGIRYDYNSIYRNTTNPRIGFVYKFTDDYVLKANYGRGFQNPSPRSLYGSWTGTTVSENLKPETIDAYEIGFLFPASQAIRNEISMFYNQIKNTNLQGKNLPKRNIYGLEYKANSYIKDVSSEIEELDVYFNYSYINPKYDETLSSNVTGRTSDHIGNVAEHKFNLGASAKFFHLFYLAVRNNYVGKRKTIITNPIKKVDAYFITNLVIKFPRLLGINGTSLSFSVNNLFDAEYYNPGNVDAGAGEDTSQPSLAWYSSRLPQPERNFILTLKTQF